MMNTRKEVQEILRQNLCTELDPHLVGHGFTRRLDSIDYLRRCEDGDQYLQITFDLRPKYHPGADSRFIPMVKVVFPKLNQMAFDMVAHTPLLIGDPEITFSQQIDATIPKENHVRWYAYNNNDVTSCMRSIRESTERWVLPFLDEYRTVDSLTKAYEKHDHRFEWQRHFYIYIVASYLMIGEIELAKRVLEDRFGKAKLRRTYASAFEFVRKRTSV